MRCLYPKTRKAGRRGLLLAILALLDACLGVSLLISPITFGPWILMPTYAWAAAWLIASVICATGILARVDKFQYSVAVLIKAAWGMRYAYLWIKGVPLSWVNMAIWLGFAAVVLIASSWPEPSSWIIRKESGSGP